MKDAKVASRRFPWLGLVLFAAALPACNGTRPWSRDRVPPASRMAYKPAQTSLRGRTFYVSGYGGADYSPTRPHKREVLRPAPGDVAPPPAGVASPPAGMARPPQVTISQGTWDEQ